MDCLIKTKQVPYTGEGIARWQASGASSFENLNRSLIVEETKRLLAGRKLAELDQAWREAYLTWVGSDPKARAAWLFVRAAQLEGWSLLGPADLVGPLGS